MGVVVIGGGGAGGGGGGQTKVSADGLSVVQEQDGQEYVMAVFGSLKDCEIYASMLNDESARVIPFKN